MPRLACRTESDYIPTQIAGYEHAGHLLVETDLSWNSVNMSYQIYDVLLWRFIKINCCALVMARCNRSSTIGLVHLSVAGEGYEAMPFRFKAIGTCIKGVVQILN